MASEREAEARVIGDEIFAFAGDGKRRHGVNDRRISKQPR
jgi:hypothetical protein